MKLNQKLKVSAYEWRHTLLFMTRNNTKGKAESAHKTYVKPIIKYVIACIASLFITWAVSMYMSAPGTDVSFTIKTVVNIIGWGAVILCAYQTRKHYKTYKTNTNFSIQYPEEHESVPMYQVNDEGLTINYYNQEGCESFISWSDVKRAGMIKTEYPVAYKTVNERQVRNEEQMLRNLRQELGEIAEHYPDYPYQEVLYPDNEISLYFTTGPLFGVSSIIPIPVSWQNDGTADELITYINEQLEKKQIKIELLKEPESIDLVQVLFPNFYERYFEE